MISSIPNFRMIRRIGEGGFGEVWLARTVTGKSRAVKCVLRERFQQPGLSQTEINVLFRTEFEGVRHFEDIASKTPELMNIFHVGQNENENAYYYVMPLADNALSESDKTCESYQPLTLERWLEIHGPMAWKEALSLLATIARGAAALHRAGLRHGDISSGNILWTDGSPVLADPGLTNLDGNAANGSTPGFSDPAADASPAGDVFSLGRLFYHALTGKHPAESFPALSHSQMAELPLRDLAELLDRCCDPDPKNRFANAGELLDALSFTVPSQQSSALT